MTKSIRHPYQLRQIELRDFKSVARTSVDLRPLTVVVGANSSGKSTLLQSILAVTQAVRSGNASAEFPLNGEFVRLGTFEETRNFLATQPNGTMEVAFRLAGWRGYRSPRFSRGSETMRDRAMTEFGWRAYLDDSSDEGETRGGFARIESLQIEIETIEPDSGERTTVLTCDVSDLDPDADLVDATDSFGPRSRFSMRDRTVAASGRVQDWASGTSAAVAAVVMSGGLPQYLMRSVRKLDHAAEVWWNTAEEFLEEEISHEVRAAAEAIESNSKPRVSRSAISRAQADIETRDLAKGGRSMVRDMPVLRGIEAFSDPIDQRWFRDLGQLTNRERMVIARSMVQLGEARFRSELRDRFRGEEWIDDKELVHHSGVAGEALWRACSTSQRFFSGDVRYLGPLREAPHVLYDPGPSKLDLGVRGEYLAAVLHAQARTWVRMPTAEGKSEQRRLNDALDHWLREFELADRARSEDRGRMGIGLSVTPQALDREVDLTSVGVGVSQILPVIVLCLLADPGTLVILEQPELHLHPQLEQKLADFLLACARSGRQLVIETHSEHLVNRLRYQIARDDTTETQELIKLVFAECEDGVTSYREPEINPYGGTGDDWPAGFLDLGAREAQALVRESLAKRKRDTAASTSD